MRVYVSQIIIYLKMEKTSHKSSPAISVISLFRQKLIVMSVAFLKLAVLTNNYLIEYIIN